MSKLRIDLYGHALPKPGIWACLIATVFLVACGVGLGEPAAAATPAGEAAATTDIAESDRQAIARATENYVQGYLDDKLVAVQAEIMAGDYARARLIVDEQTDGSATRVFLKREQGAWRVLTIGSSFSVATYQQFGIPQSLWLH